MAKVVVEDNGRVAVLRLKNGVTNAIGPDMVDDLSGALSKIEQVYDGMVLAGGHKFFSMGFDLPVLLALKRNEFADFFHRFNDVVLRLFTIGIPTCCAIAGHAVAGGSILSQSCDYRCAVPEKKLGLNEIRLGLPVPYLADLILRQLVGDRAATGVLYGGQFLAASDGIKIGLVDETCSMEEVEDRAMERVAELAAHSQAAFRAIKANRVAAVGRKYEAHQEMKNAQFLDCWFDKTAQALLKEASRKF